MEDALGVKYNRRGEIVSRRAVVRYADDFAIFCETKEDAEQAQIDISKWLKSRGLELSKEKTRIVHLNEGFCFLGFNIKHYRVSNTKTGWKLLIKPSKESILNIRKKLREEWLNLKGHDIKSVIKKLNPIIRGEANYFRIGVASEAFRSLDDWMFKRECRYVNHTHPNRNNKWRKKKYWGRLNLERKDKWVFGDKRTGFYLIKFSWFNIQRHQLVLGRSSPDDSTLKDYWKEREKAKASNHPKSIQKIAEKQGHVCPVCGQSLYNGEEIHKHHKFPRNKGGLDTYSNLELVHIYCHHQIHSGATAT
ncbi:group II intron maturase-specific domain-containing protein [Nostoc sp. KVJ20]|uniref:group II intron reverse transcriptase n=1 Tax=Nostoc sp. KVJ20 TaxID=457944 RepID=UPI000AD7C5F9|nr:group II intron maturase-specific domain-containing protein [Nostoc sp. KVJ20]